MTGLPPERIVAYCRRELDRLDNEQFPSTTRDVRRAVLQTALTEALNKIDARRQAS